MPGAALDMKPSSKAPLLGMIILEFGSGSRQRAENSFWVGVLTALWGKHALAALDNGILMGNHQSGVYDRK